MPSARNRAERRKRRTADMEWITTLRQAVNYMEVHLLEDINAADVAGEVHISPFYLQKGFKIMTDYSISEYIRCRRLYLAALEQAICDYNIVEYGVCIDDLKENQEGKFRYMIAGVYYAGGDVPEGMRVYTFPDMEWAKFRCCGKMPVALQDVNTKIYKEWLPGNPDYEMAMGANIEWYDKGDLNAVDYRSEIWIPVKRK